MYAQVIKALVSQMDHALAAHKDVQHAQIKLYAQAANKDII